MSSPGIPFMVLAFLVCIGPLIFIHELGHYYAGRWFGVKADTFSIGFGREIAGWTDKRGTRWKVGWLPLGGYVKFAGDMNPASQASDEWMSLPAEERAKTFQSKKLWQRFIIVAAGPITNFLFAIVAFMILFAAIGYPGSPPATIGAVQPNSAAAQAGFQVGDRITAANGGSIDTFSDLQRYVMLRPDQNVVFNVRRGESNIELRARIRNDIKRDQFGNTASTGLLGVSPSNNNFTPLKWYQIPGAAVGATANTVEMMVTALGQVIVGQRSVRELGGPLKIAEVSGQQASLGWLPFFLLMTTISINLGFINLLPIPLLDGGHLLFYTIEGIRRKPLKPATQEWAFRTGLAMLLALMVFVTINDLASFGLFTRLGGLIG